MINRITQFLRPTNLLAASSILINIGSFYWQTTGDIRFLENKDSLKDKQLDKMEIKLDRLEGKMETKIDKLENKMDELILILVRKNSFK